MRGRRQRWGRFDHPGRKQPVMARTPLGLVAVLFLAACGAEAPPPTADQAFVGPLPTDFVVVIDNSRSITRREQVLVREVTMLLVDLAEVGDRVSVVTFGRGADLVSATPIRNDADKLALKDRIRNRVDFRHNFSDIHAGIRLVAERRNELFRPNGESNRAVILLTDGRLEPSSGELRRRFDELREDLAGPLADTDVYAVALGNTTSIRPVLTVDGQTITGLVLMDEFVARTRGRFFHASSLDQLLEIVVLILDQTKGISSLGEAGGTEFRVDDTVESLTLIARKRTTSGERLFQSRDVRISWQGEGPEAQEVPATPGASTAFGEATIYWSNDFEYFDVVIVRDPQPGIWRVGLADGGEIDVMSRIDSPTELRHNTRTHYFLNEGSTIVAGLFDRQTGEFSRDLYEVRARMAIEGELDTSNTFVTLQADTSSGQYSIEAPAGIDEAVAGAGEARAVVVEFVAQRWADTTRSSYDPWFIRRSPPVSIELLEPFVTWQVVRPRMTRLPVIRRLVSYGDWDWAAWTPLGATLLSSGSSGSDPRVPSFDVPPRLTVTIERYDRGEQRYTQYSEETLAAAAAGREYNAPDRIEDTGSFRYRYSLAGNTARGPFVLESPWMYTTIRTGTEFVALALLLALTILHASLRRTVKLVGQIRQTAPEAIPLKKLEGQVERVPIGASELELRAVVSFFRRRIRATVIKGAISVNGRRLKSGSPDLQQKKTYDFKESGGDDTTRVEARLKGARVRWI